jgi:two-component system phosphate regulon sensor histidine kinase PhoR
LHNVPFHFKVTDKKEQEVYRCNDLFGDQKADYVQVLFPNDPGLIAGKVHLYFPTRAKYIRDPLWVFVPSILFTAVVLAVFAFVIIVIFRQKKLSDMKNDFINNMTHEFKTPISTISLASQMLRDADVGKTPSVMKNISGIIADETKRLSFQVDKVLQVSLFERDKSTLSFKEVDVNKVLRNVVSTFQLKVESIGGKIREEISGEEALVFADEMHLTNVIFNLLDNAMKYRNERPLLLQVLSKQSKGQLIIKISDNGIGIKKEYLKKVFERFYRAPSGNVHNVKGFGLGLAYVRKIIQDHKGSITAESELNIGTTFTIHLPLIKKQL